MPEPQPAPPAAEMPLPKIEPTGGHFAAPTPGEKLPTSQTTPGPIPLEFRHVWAIERKDCTADPALTRIAVAPGAVRFYEGRSVVAGADMSTTGLLTLDVEHVSEGQTINETHKLKLGADARTLTYERRGATFVYARCD